MAKDEVFELLLCSARGALRNIVLVAGVQTDFLAGRHGLAYIIALPSPYRSALLLPHSVNVYWHSRNLVCCGSTPTNQPANKLLLPLLVGQGTTPYAMVWSVWLKPLTRTSTLGFVDCTVGKWAFTCCATYR